MLKKVLFLLLSVVSHSVFGQVANVTRRASIAPSLVTLNPNETVTFKVIINAAAWMPTVLSAAYVTDKVTWSVNGVTGGNDEFGTIDRSGLYTAPATIPSPHEIHVMGEVDGVQNRKLFATVILASGQPCYESTYQHAELASEQAYFRDPHGVTLDKDGNLVIADEKMHRVSRFSPNGKFLGYVGGGQGEKDGQFFRPRMVLCDVADGDVYVCDQKEFGNRIQIFTSEGKLKKTFGPPGTEPGKFLRLHGMGFDTDGNLYVVDVDNSKVTKMTHEGEYISSWGKAGSYGNELNEPHGLMIDPNNDIFVASYYGTIKKFDANGNYLFSFAEANPPNGPVNIHAIAGDKWGNVYAIVRVLGEPGTEMGDPAKRSRGALFNVEKFNNNGDFVCGINLVNMSHSESHAVVSDEGIVYVLYAGDNTAGFEVFSPK